MADTTDVIEILEHLTNSAGWRHMAQAVRLEWTERERRGRINALNEGDDKRALDKLRQITAAQEAVEWVLAWPGEEVLRLGRQLPSLEPASMSRRGRL